MVFWLICALLAVVVTVAALRPVLIGSSTARAPDDPDLQVYKDQLAEVERDIARGLLTEQEAEAARIEISRRILALRPGTPGDGAGEAEAPRSAVVFYAAAALVVVSSLGIYLAVGSPGYSGQPFAERASRPAKGAPVQELVARVEARLREAPDDGEGWDVLAPVYLKQKRNRDAVHAFNRAIALLGESEQRLRGLAEAHLAASNGIVVEPAREAFRKLLAKQPNLVAPRFWLAVGLEQDGKRDAARAAYQALLDNKGGDGKSRLPPALTHIVRQRIAAVSSGRAGKPAASPAAPSSPAAPEAGKVPAPPAGMAASMSPEQRAAMIEQMVSGLANRLKEGGGSVEEWQRLIRAYWVLGRRDRSAAALGDAKRQFAKDAAVTKQLDTFARELGLNPG